jgi:hypothetical protein
MFQIQIVDKIKTHIFCSVTFFFPKIEPFITKLEEFRRAREAADGNMAARCMLGK